MKQSGVLRRQSQAELVEKYRMVGESETFLDAMGRVSRAARVNRPVLIIGERGTGKELVAARLHYLSPRWQKPKVSINCAAFAESLLESEIFGYEQGAFTGAQKMKMGRFELADEGTLFLDELAQSPMALQEKILRVLEYGEMERVGGVTTIKVDVRVIAATNADLPDLCDQGKFRHDLLDRLSFEVITLPPLRERREDIPLLTRVFSVKMSRELELETAPEFSESAMAMMIDYTWPGNVRELKNVVERAVYQSMGEMIKEVVFDPFDSPFRPVSRSVKKPEEKQRENNEIKNGFGEFPANDLQGAIELLERKLVSEALERNQFNQKKTAEDLGVSYYQLRRTMKRLDMSGGKDDEP
jgi:psp operon transcriptional activator